MFFRGLPDYEVAKQLASLINVHNGLSLKRRSVDIMENHVNYIVETHGKLVIAGAGVERVSFAFSEVKHVVVHPAWRRRGVGRFTTKRALQLADTPLIYCTVGADNEASVQLFENLGFTKADKYPTGKHDVILLTRAAPRWRGKCKEPIWRSASPNGRAMGLSGPTSELPSWDASDMMLLEENT